MSAHPPGLTCLIPFPSDGAEKRGTQETGPGPHRGSCRKTNLGVPGVASDAMKFFSSSDIWKCNAKVPFPVFVARLRAGELIIAQGAWGGRGTLAGSRNSASPVVIVHARRRMLAGERRAVL